MANDLDKYINYIKNTGRVPLKTEMFDEDWEPVGPRVRQRLIVAGIITEDADGIRLVV